MARVPLVHAAWETQQLRNFYPLYTHRIYPLTSSCEEVNCEQFLEFGEARISFAVLHNSASIPTSAPSNASGYHVHTRTHAHGQQPSLIVVRTLSFPRRLKRAFILAIPIPIPRPLTSPIATPLIRVPPIPVSIARVASVPIASSLRVTSVPMMITVSRILPRRRTPARLLPVSIPRRRTVSAALTTAFGLIHARGAACMAPQMHKVTIIATLALAISLKRAAFAFPKVCDGGKLGLDESTGVPPSLKGLQGILRRFFISELDVSIAGKMVSQILADPQFVDGTEVVHLLVDVEIEVVEVVLDVVRGDLRGRETLGCGGGEDLIGGLVEVLQEDGLAEERLVVDAGAAVAMTTGADLVVEGAVDLVLFRAVD